MNKDILHKVSIWTLFLTIVFSLSCNAQKKFDSIVTGKKEELNSVNKLVKRVLKGKADDFKTELIPTEKGKDVFEIDKKGDQIVLRGSDGVSIASALNFYLKNIAHCDITWDGTNLNLPDPLPLPDKMIRKETPYKYRYYLNYCTFNYTMSWWNWKRWEREIDWMALNGINMPLALTGQNYIWYKVYKSLGFTDKDLEGFFSGPAYFSWFWMGNLDGWDGPLPKNWMKSHEVLQKKILERERSLGMIPVLPAFTGHVPPSFKDKFPKAKLVITSWLGFPEVNILDPNEPMFTKIGKKFIEEETKTYGTNHLYSADIFNENTPPTNDSTFLNNVSKKVYQSMAVADPEAVWVMQGWLFYFAEKFWQPTQMKAMLNAVPDDKMIILDLYSERFPVWNITDAYYGKPWIWNMLHNFGGRINLYGLMNDVAKDPSSALHNPNSGKMVGIGLTMEGIGQNPVIYELMMENVWRETPIDLNTWLKDYIWRRYGKKNVDAEKAWNILRQTVYADTITAGGPVSIITCLPTFNKDPDYGGRTTKLAYSPIKLLKALDYMIEAHVNLQSSDGYQFDLVDITRQVLANYASVIQQQFAVDYKKKDITSFKKHTQQFIELIDDLDRLLATRKEFLLGRWLDNAKKWGTNENEKKLYEKNARDLITLWGDGDEDSALPDYACKQWSGMLVGFYKPRWQQFFKVVTSAMEKGSIPDLKKFEEQIKKWEWAWVNGHEIYSTKPHGNPVATALKMYEKYAYQISQAYSNADK